MPWSIGTEPGTITTIEGELKPGRAPRRTRSVSVNPIGLPSFTDAGALSVAAGATFSTDTEAVYSLTPPSWSRTLAPTVRARRQSPHATPAAPPKAP